MKSPWWAAHPDREWSVAEINRYRDHGLYPGDTIWVPADVFLRQGVQTVLRVRCTLLWLGTKRAWVRRVGGGPAYIKQTDIIREEDL